MNSNSKSKLTISIPELAALVSSVVGHLVRPDELVSCQSIEDVGVTSLHMFRLIGEIEERLGLTLGDDEIEPSRFLNLEAIAATIGAHGVTVLGSQDPA